MFKKISEHLCLEKETMTIQQHASFDSSAAELNATSKLVKAWESKNAKNAAKAGGISLMALSLAACGGSSTPVADAPAADPVVPVVGAAQSFTLTTTVDTLTGGSGNDSFVGVNLASVAAGDTMSAADTLDGGAGTDTLTITNTEAGSLSDMDVSNIENIVIRSTNENDTVETLDMSNMSGATSLTLNKFTDGVTVSNVVLGTTLAINNFTTDAAADDVTFTFASATGTADVAAISIVSSTLEQVVADAIETLSVNVSGATVTTIASLDAAQATSITIDNSTPTVGTAPGLTISAVGDNTATSMTFTGAGTTTATGALSTGLTTITGSAATGALDLNISTNTNNLTMTLGSGNDRVEAGTVGTNLTADDTWDLGTGTNTLAIDDTSLTAGDITNIKSVNGVSTLEFTTTTAESTYDANAIGTINTFVLSGAITDAAGAAGTAGETTSNGTAANNQALSLTGVEAGDTFTLKENVTGGVGGAGGAIDDAAEVAGGAGAAGSAALVLTEELVGGANTASLVLSGAAITGGAGGAGGDAAEIEDNAAGGAGGAGAVGINAATFETINIQSSTAANTIAGGAGGAGGDKADDGAVGAAGAAGASIEVNTNGTINITGDKALDMGTIAGTNATVNASTFTGALTVTGEAGNNVITGGSGADVINGGTGQDTLTGGAGADDFVFTLADNVTGGDPDGLVFDIIKDFNTGADEIDFSVALTIETATGTAAVGTANINSEGFATFHSADDTLAEKITATEAAIRAGTESAGDFALFEHSGDTYMYVHDGEAAAPDAGDALIKLEGVTGLSDTTLVGGDLFIA
ncbi:hypothetical protein OAO37_08970 [Planktomarina temperata]|nr:hypothetical protein [Planktomarina temperata]